MSTAALDALLLSWDHTLRYGLRLLGGIPAERMAHVPIPGVNCPAWEFCHLHVYHPAILSLARGEAVADPGKQPDAAHFDEGTVPSSDPALYPSHAAITRDFQQAHDSIANALRQSGPAVLEKPPGLDRWARNFETTGGALVYLMIHHEGIHLGHVSVWRKMQGMPGV